VTIAEQGSPADLAFCEDGSDRSSFGSAERRRSRTDRAWGCHAAPVLKTGWATGPVPLREPA
jgi:hypothetical protein